MPRNIEFNSDAVLSAAMHEFRMRGYAGVSIKDLERATGLTSGSLYNSFGGKDQIFTRILEHYNEVVVRKRVKDHLETNSPLEGLRSLFMSLLEESNDETFGCLLTNTAIEFGASDSVAKSSVQEGFDILEHAFQEAVNRLEQTAFSVGLAISAEKLLTLYQGVLVLVRFGRTKDQLRQLINNEFNQLMETT